MHFPFVPEMKSVARLARIIVLLTLAAALAACSAVKLGYNNLDQAAYWWLDSYLDFTTEQSVLVRQDLARLHAWHRAEELPRIGDMLHRMEQLAPGNITPAQACQFVAEFRQQLGALADHAEPAVVTMAISLSPEQLAHLQHKYEKNIAKYRDEWVDLSAAELREKRFEQFLKGSDMIYGSLDEPQREALRRDVERTIFDPKRILVDRQRRQADALQTLRQVTSGTVDFTTARRLMRGYIERFQASPDKRYREYQEALIQEGCRHFAALHNSTTAAQRQGAVQRLRAYQQIVVELTAQ
jgi:hypothetical protein